MDTSLVTPDLSITPAPWTLSGDGIIVPFWMDKRWRAQHFPDYTGRLGVLMWVNYHQSPVGPYREWMLIPGRLENPAGKHFSIANIMVDSKKSMLSGQANWGIPKQLASFDWEFSPESWSMSMSYEQSSADIQGRPVGPKLPINSRMLPFSLYQQWQQQDYWTRPLASGYAQWFNIRQHQVHGDGLANIISQQSLGAYAISDFSMTFQVARREP